MARWKWSLWSRKSNRFATIGKGRFKPLSLRHRLGLELLEDRTVPSGFNPNEIVDTTFTPTQLAESLVGAGLEVSNVKFTGGTASTGAFTFANPGVIGFDHGIILSSGSAADVVGPNLADWTSTDFTLPGDNDLDTLSGYTTFDAAVLEFDFIPTANQVVFNYAFASDEYPEWVNTPYNDVFAFYVNGTNYAVVRQVAGDPSAPFVPVAVNNINNGNPDWYPEFIPTRPDLFRANYVDPNGGASALDLELDGITSVLTFQAPVIPGELNHMKLAIADASDGIYDSAVFIKAGSLVSNENPVADVSLSPSTGAAPLAVTAIIEAEDPNGAPLTYTINWGDGSPDSTGSLDYPLNDNEKTALVDHTYTSTGEYIVTLTVSNGTLSGTSTEDVHVLPGAGVPVVTSNPSDQTVFEGEVFSFTAAASGATAVQWQVSTDSGATFVDILGATSTTFSATASLADDGHLYQAVFSNSQGSVTTTSALLTVLPVDTTPPVAPGVALTEDTGFSSSDLITSIGTLSLSNIETGAAVEYSVDGGIIWNNSFSAVEGLNTVSVRQTDTASNVSDATSLSFVLDTAALAPGVALAEDTGSSATDLITRNGTLSLSEVESSAVVEYSVDGGAIWSSSFGAVEGLNAVLVCQTDVAGNVSGSATFSFTLDTMAPELQPTFSAAQPFLVGAVGITVSPNATDETGIDTQFGGPVDTSSAGHKVVVCTATDLAGNTASVEVPYVVGYEAVNVLPLAGSTFKRTAKIQVSFQLADANGLLTDQAAAALLPNISVAFDGKPAVSVKYHKNTNSFTATLKPGLVPVGAFDIVVHVKANGLDVTAVLIPINLI